MVSTSLFTGLSGLRTHQQSIDVIGNNLANVSTPGYWSSRTTFGDILSFTMRSGSVKRSRIRAFRYSGLSRIKGIKVSATSYTA